MVIALKKARKGMTDAFTRRNNKEGLKELRNDYKFHPAVTIKGTKTHTIFITNDKTVIRGIKVVANNYTIEYEVL